MNSNIEYVPTIDKGQDGLYLTYPVFSPDDLVKVFDYCEKWGLRVYVEGNDCKIHIWSKFDESQTTYSGINERDKYTNKICIQFGNKLSAKHSARNKNQ